MTVPGEGVISLEQFLDEMREALDAFELHWRAKNRLDPSGYPMKFNADDRGTWDEQFAFFQETHRQGTTC